MSQKLEAEGVLIGEVSYPFEVDDSLEKDGCAADAAEVGRRLKAIEERLDVLNPVTATGLSYDKTESGLQAENVQSAVDEIAGKLSTATENIDKAIENGLNEIDNKMSEYLKVADKPSGKFEGNGSSAQREINTGSSGNVLIVYSCNSGTVGGSVFFVTPFGAVGHNSGNEYSIGSNAMSYEDGILRIQTTNDYVNKKDVDYFYQVL